MEELYARADAGQLLELALAADIAGELRRPQTAAEIRSIMTRAMRGRP